MVAIAAVPAILFATTWRVSAAMIPEESVPTTIPPAAPQLSTPLLSMRRDPGAITGWLQRQDAETRAEAAFAAFDDQLDSESCAAVVDVDSKTSDHPPLVVFEHQAELPLIPASNEKLLVAAAALSVLGESYTFRTELRGAEPSNGIIDGPLFVVGGGDPTLSTAEFAVARELVQFSVTDIKALIDALAWVGVKQITGPIVGIDDRYDVVRRRESWLEAITPYDVAPVGALVINDGLDAGASVPDDPALTAAETLRSELAKAGIVVDGDARSARNFDLANIDVAALPVVAKAESAPLSEILREMLVTSDNLTAEMLVKEIGLQSRGQGSWDAGLAAMEAELEGFGVDLDSVVIDDGSGLSRDNRITCSALVELVYATPVSDRLVPLLPVAGESGTLSGYFSGTPAAGQMRAKTGTLIGVKALTGLQPDGVDEDVAFALVLNSANSKDRTVFEPIWNSLAKTIDGLGATPQIERSAFEPK